MKTGSVFNLGLGTFDTKSGTATKTGRVVQQGGL